MKSSVNAWTREASSNGTPLQDRKDQKDSRFGVEKYIHTQTLKLYVGRGSSLQPRYSIQLFDLGPCQMAALII